MCGTTGIVGSAAAADRLVDDLRRMEYRLNPLPIYSGL